MKKGSIPFHRSSIFLMGQSWFRLGQEYERGQLGNAEALGLGLFPVEEAKQK